MALQLPQNTSSNPQQSAAEQVDPNQQFGHMVEQQANAPSAPNAPQIFDTGAIVGKAAEGLSNVVEDIAAKAKALKAAEEHSKLQNDTLDIQQKYIDARKESQDYALKEGLNIDEQKADYERRKDNIHTEYSSDRFTDSDVRRAWGVRSKELQMKDAQNYEETVVMPGRAFTVKNITDKAASNYLTFLENNPQTTAEVVDASKKQLTEVYNSPYAQATLGPEVAAQRTKVMLGHIDHRVADNKIEEMMHAGIEDSATMPEAKLRVEAYRAKAEAVIRSRHDLSAEQIDKLTDKLEKSSVYLLSIAESTIKAKEDAERLKVVTETEHKTFDITEGLRMGKVRPTAAVSYMLDQQDKAQAALANGHEKIAQYHWMQADKVQKAIDNKQLRDEVRASRITASQQNAMNYAAIIQSGGTVTDMGMLNAGYEKLTTGTSAADGVKRVELALTHAPQWGALPSGMLQDIQQNTSSTDPKRAAVGYQQIDRLVKARPDLLNHLPDNLQIEYMRVTQGGQTPAEVKDSSKKLATMPRDVKDHLGAEFDSKNYTNKFDNSDTLVTRKLASKTGVSVKNIDPRVVVAATARARDMYIQSNGDIKIATELAIDNHTNPNPNVTVNAGKTEFGPKETLVPNAPETIITLKYGVDKVPAFKKQLNEYLKTQAPNPDPSLWSKLTGKGNSFTHEDVRTEYLGDKNGAPVFRVYAPDPTYKTLSVPLTDIVYDNQKAIDDADKALLESRNKDMKARADEIKQQKKDAEYKRKTNEQELAPIINSPIVGNKATGISANQIMPLKK